MAKQTIVLGTAPTGVGGDTARSANIKVNANFDEVYLNFFQKSHILGTVSQSGGVATGAIIEQGYNVNGNYTMWADGTLICSGFRDLGAQTFTSTGTAAALFYTGAFSQTYAKPFIGLPRTNLSVLSSDGLCWSTQGSTLPGTAVSQGFYIFSLSAASKALSLTYMAIGRWF